MLRVRQKIGPAGFGTAQLEKGGTNAPGGKANDGRHSSGCNYGIPIVSPFCFRGNDEKYPNFFSPNEPEYLIRVFA
ncbi:MAG: hypothetical protein Q9P90_07885 [candidate division KSB1 bacterium]|nr:hypothetical protein [candidate division KSB1 bacterium]